MKLVVLWTGRTLPEKSDKSLEKSGKLVSRQRVKEKGKNNFQKFSRNETEKNKKESVESWKSP